MFPDSFFFDEYSFILLLCCNLNQQQMTATSKSTSLQRERESAQRKVWMSACVCVCMCWREGFFGRALKENERERKMDFFCWQKQPTPYVHFFHSTKYCLNTSLLLDSKKSHVAKDFEFCLSNIVQPTVAYSRPFSLSFK